MTATAEAAALPRLEICPCCGGADLRVFYRTASIPVHSCLMLDTAEAASAFARDDLELAVCGDCGFLTNRKFNPKWSAYAPEYEDQQSFSPTFNSFAGRLAQDLVERYDLHGKRIVEVGCSKGDFLALLCEAGGNSGVGIDPSVAPGRVSSPAMDRIRFIQAYYGPEHVDLPADFICCRHTLEHIQPVETFVSLLRDALERNPGATLMIEVPDVGRVLRECAFEDIYYEHCSYFTPGSLAALMRRVGLAVYDLRIEYGDQYIVVECGLDQSRDRRFDIADEVADILAAVEAFEAQVDDVKRRWIDVARECREQGEGLAIWGSGSKCVAFLTSLGLETSVASVVDINPNRHGKHIPGIALEIDPPARLAELRPKRVIVMNRIYRDEIAAELARLKVQASVLAL